MPRLIYTVLPSMKNRIGPAFLSETTMMTRDSNAISVDSTALDSVVQLGCALTATALQLSFGDGALRLRCP